MTPDEILLMFYYKGKNVFRNIVSYNIFRFINRKGYKTVKNNAIYKDIHKGKRCFILGNGPSIKTEDLSLLKDEYVFVVNQSSRNSYYEKVKPNYYICVDPVFFRVSEENEGDMEMLKALFNINCCGASPKCFFPIEEKVRFIERFEIDKKLDVNYFKQGLNYHEKYKRKINFAKMIPGSGTVVHYAISLAIYMGFSEIYLLGCDTTGIMVSINALLNNITDADYSYHVTDVEKNRIKQMVSDSSLERLCKSYYNTLCAFRWIYEYCKRKGIKMINCSSSSVIEVIPRRRLGDVLTEELNQQIELNPKHMDAV